jgi:alkylation response protein AidB-like acyl-CoA dehydrogenase
MNLGFSESQEMLRRTAREFLESNCPATLVRELENSEKGYSPELWKKVAEMGWLGILFPSRYGGADGTLIDQLALSEEIGRAILPSPMITSSVLSGLTIINSGTEKQKARILPQMARGDVIVTLALIEPSEWHNDALIGVHAIPDKGSYIINGTKLFVPYANVADYLICVTRTDLDHESKAPPDAQDVELTLFVVNQAAPGITIIPLESTAGYKQHEILFTDVRVPAANMLGELGCGRAPLAKAIEYATIIQCSEMVGRAEKILDMVVEYSKVRMAFERPIGNFQAVQHRCADLRVAIDGARLVTYQAAWKLTENMPCTEDISIAKAFAGSTSRIAVETGHAIFAGISFALEHDMQLYTMRSKISESYLGDSDFHLTRLSENMANNTS